MTTSEFVQIEHVVRKLMLELDHAYHGIATIPASHPAAVAFKEAAALVSTLGALK